MPDSEQNIRLRQIFNEWRIESAVEEKEYLDTALLINAYTEDNELSTIQQDLIDDQSPTYLAFDQFKKRSISSILFVRLIIADYMQQCSNLPNEEEALLKEILANLDNLYTKPSIGSKQTVKDLISNTHGWLDKYAMSGTNPEKTKATCLSLFMMLKLVDITLNKLGYIQKKLASSFIDDIKPLFTKIEHTVAALDRTMADAHAATNVPNTIATEIDNIIEAIDVQINVTTPDGINLLQTEPEDIQTLLDDNNKKRNELIAHRDHANALLVAINTNEEKITGRIYALELIESNQESFDILYRNATEQEQQEWDERIRQLKTPSTTESIITAGQYVASWVTVIPTVTYRTITPTTVQQAVSNWSNLTLSTFDSECKTQLKKLAQSQLTGLDAEIKKSDEEIKRLIDINLATLEQHTPSAIDDKNEEETISSDQQSELINEFILFRKTLVLYTEKLEEIVGLDKNIDAFVKEHHNIAVKISLFLSKLFSSIFKTEKAISIENALAMKNSLIQLKEAYKKNIEGGIAIIRESADIPESSRRDIEDHLSHLNIETISQSEASTPLPSNFKQSFNTIRNKYITLNRQPDDVASEELEPDDNRHETINRRQ